MNELEPKQDAVVTAWMERKPKVAVPIDFAARVVARLPAEIPVRERAGLGRRAAVAGAAALGLAMFALAAHATPSVANFAFDMEVLVLVQLAALAYWLAVPRGLGR